ncbi:carboxypeptidase-like regulatory domain-containing protein [Microbacterium sp. TPD7012]|uniref:MSCRAMM family protein n=1 Tax=Microbacterium sp. TPD7012 TaxID=2171975 RepID=UPI000D518D59|nr:carboxypeptidase-like regulatory domain-containing protein [Microbacterium sp. TPD7012]PVE98438.1 hypothetical protein DC434_03020 [Microbacterium sp. TPD7012]
MTRRRGMMRAMLGGMAAFALALGGATTAAAAGPEDAAGSGFISGVVTREDDGTPLEGVTVSAGGEGAAWVSTQTDETGAYSLTGLAPGSHLVSFTPEGTDLKSEYWENAERWDSATPIVIGDGTVVAGIDAALSVGGTITGVVTREDDSSPLENVSVSALDAHNEIVGMARTDATGGYHLGGLPDGSYRLRFGSPDPELLSEFWENQYRGDSGTVIAVVSGQTTAGVDAALAAAGYISGTVTSGADGQPLFSSVLVYDVDERFDFEFSYTEVDGGYRVAVPAGTYKVLFRSSGLAEEWWNDAPVWDAATAVTVSAGDEVEGVDAVLDEIATVTGTVTVDAGAASEILVEAWSDGIQVANKYADPATGAYSMLLQKGTYILKATATFTDGATATISQFFDGVETAAEATPLSLSPGDIVQGIDFLLTADTEPEPALVLSSGAVQAGGDITVSGTGFAPGAEITFELHSDPIVLGTLTADAGGVLKGSFTIPASAPAGAHTLVAFSGVTVVATAALNVTAAGSAGSGGATTGGTGGALANTGSDAPVAAAATALLLLLAGLTLVRRRRRVQV